MNFSYFKALFLLSRLSPLELIDIAKMALHEGYENNSIKKLANLSKSNFSSSPVYFRQVLNDLKVPEMTKYEAGIILAQEICEDIILGKIDPYKGARKIWTELWEEAGYPEELRGFVNDATDYEETYPPDPLILENIKKESVEFLRKMKEKAA